MSKPTGGKVGRPSIRTPQNATKICVLLSEGMSLRAICRMEAMPSKQAVLEWPVGVATKDDEEVVE